MHDSLIFVVLAGAWLVLLVPMLAQHRQQVRRIADAALATRVLHRGDSGVRLAVRRGPAAGHPSDPYWTAEQGVDEIEEETVDEQDGQDDEGYANHANGHPRLDRRRADGQIEDGEGADEHVHRAGRGGYDPQADAIARRARHAFRQRVTLTLLAVAVLTLLGGLVGVSALWWPHLLTDLTVVGYLTFLRRQTRIEEDVRERRIARHARARLGVEVDDEYAEKLGGVPRRLRRPGAVVLEIDDEDPAFDELEPPFAPAEMELPRASGQ